MNLPIGQLNLVSAWLGILLGFISGLYFGLNFQREDWLGGYGSFKRRLYRLGHISFFGLAVVNFMFYATAERFSGGGPLIGLAAWAFIIGAVSMPACCLIMAHFPRGHALFAIPVSNLLAGGILTLIVVCRGTPSIPNADSSSAGAQLYRSVPSRRTGSALQERTPITDYRLPGGVRSSSFSICL